MARAELSVIGNSKAGVISDVRKIVEIRDYAVHKIAHVEGFDRRSLLRFSSDLTDCGFRVSGGHL